VGEWLLSFFVWTPTDWAGKHRTHHADSGDLKKGPTKWSDTVYFTTKEYDSLKPLARTGYRVLRDPVFFFSCVPFLNWFVRYRLDCLRILDITSAQNRERALLSIANTIGAVTVILSIDALFGSHVRNMYLVSLYLAAVLGMALFHLQHTYNPSYIAREGWNLKDSALHGSSILPIPWFLKVWTMGIEYHHIHHYSPYVPGYLLKRCHEEAPSNAWEGVVPLTYDDMAKSLFYTLYDEESKRFVSFGRK